MLEPQSQTFLHGGSLNIAIEALCAILQVHKATDLSFAVSRQFHLSKDFNMPLCHILLRYFVLFKEAQLRNQRYKFNSFIPI